MLWWKRIYPGKLLVPADFLEGRERKLLGRRLGPYRHRYVSRVGGCASSDSEMPATVSLGGWLAPANSNNAEPDSLDPAVPGLGADVDKGLRRAVAKAWVTFDSS